MSGLIVRKRSSEIVIKSKRKQIILNRTWLHILEQQSFCEAKTLQNIGYTSQLHETNTECKTKIHLYLGEKTKEEKYS